MARSGRDYRENERNRRNDRQKRNFQSNEKFYDINEAIYYEKCLKKWRRGWKLKLIEESNPQWVDLYDFVLL